MAKTHLTMNMCILRNSYPTELSSPVISRPGSPGLGAGRCAGGPGWR